ncbi:hypothetical protein [Brevundimonas sp. P7753]|uniref:hypothetical protein n=1 Tax=Brevundimonas sp. P7753 TaxID=2726982 RepID=UPI0015BEE430|nr:hypothetical protein [Brevundimonas sp. P7753]NWE53565.1 hypothetical protein [Brevundimonas sp. P7753]
MTEEQQAAAVKATIENLREEAWGLAQQYVMDQRQMTLDRMKQLKEAADLLAWAAEGKGGYKYDINAMID